MTYNKLRLLLLMLFNLMLFGCETTNKEKEQVFNLEEKTVSQLQQMMTEGEMTASEMTQIYLDRIALIDQGTDGLNAVIEINPDALEIAQQLDKERSEGKVRGPLHGIPVMIKDNINTADDMETTAGSLALVGSNVARDAFIVKQLRESGAILLGKTNLSEWANFRSMRSSSGWSGRGRQTKNPYAKDRSPCGSSAGSGAAVSANLCAITIGTETNGSVVCPASVNGVVGIKPTVGLWSREGIIPISKTQDTAGPMGRTVADAVALLGPLAHRDSEDLVTMNDGVRYEDYTQFLKKDGLRGKRIGIYRNPMGQHEGVDAVMEQAILTITSAGGIIIDSLDNHAEDDFGQAGLDVLLYEFKDGLNRYLSTLDSKFHIHSLSELIEYNERNSNVEMPYFKQEILKMAQKVGDLDDQVYIDALSFCLSLAREKGIDKMLEAHDLDAIMSLTGGPAWTIDEVNGDNYTIHSSSLAAVAGYPNISVPAGDVLGLPIGVSFFSTAYTEAELIEVAYSFEQHVNARIVPKLGATLSLP